MRKLTIEDMENIVTKRNGHCLSKNYIDSKTKLKWQCKKGHLWEAVPGSIRAGHWCPYCGGSKRLNLIEMKNIAKLRRGKCLSKRYLNGRIKLKWQCRKRHVWYAAPNNIKTQKQWCPYCAGVAKLDINKMRKLAKIKGGVCLSKNYTNTKTKLRWKCKEGHVWMAAPNNVKAGYWCPICSTGISERICRKYFEVIFNKKFPKVKPEWLVNKDGKRMELDGYNKKLGIAFEYQGRQHYQYNIRFHSKRSFKKQLEADILKKRLCKNMGITLIEVPYSIKYEDMSGYIIKQCNQLKIEIAPFREKVAAIDLNIFSPNAMKEIQAVARTKRGICLSKKYINSETKLKWQCQKGHIWLASPNQIKQGHWCPYCSRNVRLTILEMQSLAAKKGGQCLSKKYINNRAKLKWRCSKGHIWQASPGGIKVGYWCPFCAGNVKHLISEMNKLAKIRGGRCLSKKYINTHTKLKWQCSKGHVWNATPGNIYYQKQWCPYCSGNMRLTIPAMQLLAHKRGGQCLSKKYINNHTKLKWQCANGHIWQAKPNHIQRGQWCPVCAKK